MNDHPRPPHIPAQFREPVVPLTREVFGPRASFPRTPDPAAARPDDAQEPQHDRPAVQWCGHPVCPPRQTCDSCAGTPAAESEPAAPERGGEAVDATPAAAPPPPDTAPRTPIAAGTYAVYDDGNGGVVLVIGTREGETHHKHIPAKLIKMGEMMMGGNNPLSAMLGGM